MTKDNKSSTKNQNPFGWVGTGLGIASLIGVFTLGPIDLARTAYNSVVGDAPLIRERAVDYCRKNFQREKPLYNDEQVEEELASDLNYSLWNLISINVENLNLKALN